MRKYEWSGLVLGVLLTVGVACKAVTPEGSETRPSEAASTATADHSPTDPPLTPTNTPLPPTSTPEATATVEPTATLAASWVNVGSHELGLEFSVPADWIAVSELVPAFGSHAIVMADSTVMARHLVEKSALEEGLFVIAFIPGPEAPLRMETVNAEDPLTLLTGVIQNSGVETTDEISAVSINNYDGAIADLNGDPTAVLGEVGETAQLQLLLLIEPIYRRPTLFLFGSAGAEGAEDSNAPVIGQMMDSIQLHETMPPGIINDLGDGSMLSHTIMPGQSDTWLFHGESGRYLTIGVRPRDDLDLVLNLVSPSGVTLLTVDRGYSGDSETIFDLLLSETGNYKIVVSEFFNSGGSYTISATETDAPQFGGGGQIQLRQVVTGELKGGQDDVWVFSATAGQIISIVLTPTTPQLDIFFELRGPDGQKVIALDETYSGDPEILTGFELPVTGDYRIIVNSFSRAVGPYTLALDEGAENASNFYDAGDLFYGDERTESLQANEVHTWFFNGYSGHEITLTAVPSGNGMDLDVWLLDPELKRLAMQDENLFGEAETITLTLPDNGEYVVIVREYYGTAGEYSIQLDSSNYYLESGVINYSETISHTLTGGYADTWTLSARSGDVISVEVVPDGSEDVSLWLIDPNGQRVIVRNSYRRGQPEQLLEFTLTATGNWKLVVRESNEAGGQYSLSVNQED